MSPRVQIVPGPVVVGGGIIGLALAFELARAGATPTVLERETCGSGAAGVAAGMLAPASEAMLEDPRLVRFGIESLRRYPAFVRRVEEASGRSCGYRQEGALWIALHADHRADLERLADVHRDLGLPSRRLDADEVAAREPRASGRAIAGLLLEGEGHVDPRALVTALAAGTAALGGVVRERAEVRSVYRAGSRLVAEGVSRAADGGDEEFAVEAETIVLAAGAWSTAGIATGLDTLAVRPVKGQIVRLEGENPVASLTLTPDVYLVPRSSGELVVGGTVEEQGFDASPTVRGVHEILRRAREAFPAVDEMRIAGLDVSFRPAVRDHLPVIGPAGPSGLHVATGHHRNGILLAPITGEMLAHAVLTGEVPPELEPFTMNRLAADGRAGVAGPPRRGGPAGDAR